MSTKGLFDDKYPLNPRQIHRIQCRRAARARMSFLYESGTMETRSVFAQEHPDQLQQQQQRKIHKMSLSAVAEKERKSK